MLRRHRNSIGILRNAIPELLNERNTLLLRSLVEARGDFDVGTHTTRLWCHQKSGAARKSAHNAGVQRRAKSVRWNAMLNGTLSWRSLPTCLNVLLCHLRQVIRNVVPRGPELYVDVLVWPDQGIIV